MPTQDRKSSNPIPTSLSLVDCIHYVFQFKCSVGKLCIKNNKVVGMGLDDFLSLGGHLLVPFFS